MTIEAATDSAELTLCVVLAAVLLRACVALHGYSGEGVKPMYGDFEAQRHWMELTVNLEPRAWYVQGRDNDLQYWGLDYPPVSAYLSWVVGQLARAFGHPELVALHASRGYESESTRVFMRRSVLVSDLLVFVPAALASATAGAPAGRARLGLLAVLCALPPLVLIDHGHFQYNCVSLGLTLWALYAAMQSRPLACCVAFSLALNTKQMSLYLAPAFFCYLLAGCLRAGGRRRTAAAAVARVARLGVAVVATFALCWLPFLSSTADALAVSRRLFPVGRALYEDKVANVWCTIALLPGLKLKQLLAVERLLGLTTGCTLGALLPPCALLLAYPSRRAFLLAAAACGLAFFLFSFQVHEKHVLLPLLPAALLAPAHPRAFGWAVGVCTFSLYPLLRRDGQVVPYLVLQLLHPLLCRAYADAPPPPHASLWRRAARLLPAASALGMLVLHAADAFVPPPARYPHLHSAAFAAYSCAHLVAFYLGLLYCQWSIARTEPYHTPLDPAGAHAPYLVPAHQQHAKAA